jgi:hypothetical protein
MTFTDAIGHRNWQNKKHFLEYHENYTGRGNLHGSIKKKYYRLNEKQRISYWNNILLNYTPTDSMRHAKGKVSKLS